MLHGQKKWSKSSKAPPGGGVEIENVTFCIFDVFNFSSATDVWTLGQKSIIQIFDTSWLDKNIRKKVKNECLEASCI